MKVLTLLLCLAIIPSSLFGRFTSVDPKREYHNPYSYVGNSPIIAVDKDGLTTIFVGGAGNRAGTASYAGPIVAKLNAAGIPDTRHIYPTLPVNNKANRIQWTMTYRNQRGIWRRGLNGQMAGRAVQPIVDSYARVGGQFNLAGYSFGSVAVAQAALALADEGKVVDNLVLIGSPIDPKNKLTAALLANENIKQVTFINISDDPFSAGVNIETARSNGLKPHFYFVSNDVNQQDQLVGILAGIFGQEQAEKLTQHFINRDPNHDESTVDQ